MLHIVDSIYKMVVRLLLLQIYSSHSFSVIHCMSGTSVDYVCGLTLYQHSGSCGVGLSTCTCTVHTG